MVNGPKSKSADAAVSTGVVQELSVVLPAFNEEANIEAVVRKCVAYLETRVPDYELLVVNDGSRDRTGEILNRLTTELPRLRPLHHPQNRGYGAALRTGFDAATKRFVFYMDGDGQFDINDLDKVLPLATDDDHIVTGFRIERRDPFIRRLNAKLFGGWLVRIMLNVRVRDLNCAFKLIPKKVLGRHHARIDRRADQRRAVRPRRAQRLRHQGGRRASLPAHRRRADRRAPVGDPEGLLRPVPSATENRVRWIERAAPARYLLDRR